MLIFIFICDDDANINEDGEINEDANICRSGCKHGEGFLASDAAMEQFDRQEVHWHARQRSATLSESSSNGKGQDTPNFPKTPLTHKPK
jgi:hypothetical protein